LIKKGKERNFNKYRKRKKLQGIQENKEISMQKGKGRNIHEDERDHTSKFDC
jgi:hypothetical protein